MVPRAVFPATGLGPILHLVAAVGCAKTDRELAKYVQFLKEENKILRARMPGQIHTRPGERERWLRYGKALGRGVGGGRSSFDA